MVDFAPPPATRLFTQVMPTSSFSNFHTSTIMNDLFRHGSLQVKQASAADLDSVK
jgi:hypothetical protein